MYHPELFSATTQYVSRERLREAEHVRAIKRARTEERAARRAEKRKEKEREREQEQEHRRGRDDAPGPDARARLARAA